MRRIDFMDDGDTVRRRPRSPLTPPRSLSETLDLAIQWLTLLFIGGITFLVFLVSYRILVNG